MLALFLLDEHPTLNLIMKLIDDERAWSVLFEEWAILAKQRVVIATLLEQLPVEQVPGAKRSAALEELLTTVYGLTHGAVMEVCRVLLSSRTFVAHSTKYVSVLAVYLSS